MSDTAFLDSDPKPRDWREVARESHERILRESFAHKMKLFQNDVERIQDYTRDMLRSGMDVTNELQELETFANGLMLVVLLLKREASKAG